MEKGKLCCQSPPSCDFGFAHAMSTNTVVLRSIKGIGRIWLRNWYGNSLTTTQLIYGPLELFCLVMALIGSLFSIIVIVSSTTIAVLVVICATVGTYSSVSDIVKSY